MYGELTFKKTTWHCSLTNLIVCSPLWHQQLIVTIEHTWNNRKSPEISHCVYLYFFSEKQTKKTNKVHGSFCTFGSEMTQNRVFQMVKNFTSTICPLQNGIISIVACNDNGVRPDTNSFIIEASLSYNTRLRHVIESEIRRKTPFL